MNTRNTITFAISGMDARSDFTRILISVTDLTLFSGRKTRIVRKAVRFAIPGIKPSHPIMTTMKSRRFQASRQ
jgi:hypothetical protein